MVIMGHPDQLPLWLLPPQCLTQAPYVTMLYFSLFSQQSDLATMFFLECFPDAGVKKINMRQGEGQLPNSFAFWLLWLFRLQVIVVGARSFTRGRNFNPNEDRDYFAVSAHCATNVRLLSLITNAAEFRIPLHNLGWIPSDPENGVNCIF